MVSAPVVAPARSLRVTRSVIVPNQSSQLPTGGQSVHKVQVAVHTSTEQILNMDNMTVSTSNISSSTVHTGVTTNSRMTMASEASEDIVQPFNIYGVIVNESLDDEIAKSDEKPEAESTGGIKVLEGLANELSETLKKEVSDETNKEKKDKVKSENREKEKRREKSKGEGREKDKDRERHKNRDKDRKHGSDSDRRRREKERQREKEKKEKKRESKPYRETEVRNGVDSVEKQRIKELAQKLRQEATSSKVQNMPKIPKIPKKDEDSKETKSSLTSSAKKPSFDDLMSAMETPSTKVVKAAPIKNKNKDLLESLSNTAPSRPAPKKNVSRPDYLLGIKTEDKSKQIIRGSSSVSKLAEKKKDEEKIKEESSLTGTVEEDLRKSLKRSSTEESESKLKLKSQSQLVDSPVFGDFLSTIIPDPPKKKKIKLSDLKAQKETKPTENIQENTEEVKSATFSFYGEGNEDVQDETEDSKTTKEEVTDEEMPFAEPESDLPREVRGILVVSRGARRTRRIQWRPESELVETEYFEVEEGERVNVNKLKFEEQRKKELEFERCRLQDKTGRLEMTDDRLWPSLHHMTLSCELPEIEYGGNSKEKKEQQLREKGTLQALFFDKQPNDPLEPESGGVFRVECKPIPLEDTTGEEEAVNDYSAQGWPDPVMDKFMVNNPPPSLPASVNILQNLIGVPAMMEGADRSMMDSALYAAQKAAQETLLKQGMLPSNFIDQNTPPPDFNQEPDFHEMEYENGPDYPPQNFPSGPPPPMDWRGGPPNRPPPSFYRGGPRGGHQRGMMRPMGPRGQYPMRGFPPRPPNGNFERPKYNHHNNLNRKEFGGGGGGGGGGGRPCKFWMSQGFCREESRCRFSHPAR